MTEKTIYNMSRVADALEKIGEAFNCLSDALTEPPPEPEGEAPEHKPEAGTPVYPCLVGDTWVDADGTEYDPERHGWSRDHNSPAVTPTGKFRAKRKSASANEVPPPAPPGNEPPPEIPKPAPADNYSPTLKAMLLNVNMAEDAGAVERISNHPFAAELADSEREVLVAACRARGAELTGSTTGG